LTIMTVRKFGKFPGICHTADNHSPDHPDKMLFNKEIGYKSIPLFFNRRAVAESASVTKEKNTIHGVTEIDITEPRRLLKEHFEKTGERLSLTAYIFMCLAQVNKEHLCITASFDLNIVDGAPASRFMNQFTETIKSGKLLQTELLID
jgi:pyruvate/2-oxoglutarate dehydrogenase complex dihydrolipoamide acyltransferase (E2) component